VSPTFEGGQTPLHRRAPKRGYMPAALHRPFAPLNLDVLSGALASGALPAGAKIDVRALAAARLVSGQSARWGVKLLAGSGSAAGAPPLPAGLEVEVSAASSAAIAAVEAAGGRVTAVFYSPRVLRALLRDGAAAGGHGGGARLDLPLKSPAPPPRLLPFYTSAAKRGYLAPAVQLAALRRRLAAGVPLPLAAQLMPVYVAGPAHVAERAGLAPAARDDTGEAAAAAPAAAAPAAAAPLA
jgi:large subunit ribosomal protein L15